MSSITEPTRAEQLATMPNDGKRYELVNGELRMISPAGFEHGRLVMRLASRLNQHVEEHQLGVVSAAETGFLLSRNPDTVRAPDVAFVEQNRLTRHADTRGYLPLAPDLVAEVVSPSDSHSEVEKKSLAWRTAGVRMVLVVEPATRTIQVYRSGNNIVSLTDQDTLDASDIVPGWRLVIGEVFG